LVGILGVRQASVAKRNGWMRMTCLVVIWVRNEISEDSFSVRVISKKGENELASRKEG
jgi:hypothetical protein